MHSQEAHIHICTYTYIYAHVHDQPYGTGREAHSALTQTQAAPAAPSCSPLWLTRVKVQEGNT